VVRTGVHTGAPPRTSSWCAMPTPTARCGGTTTRR
jgi:hypothetical protein